MTFEEYPDTEFMMMKVADLIASELRNCLTMHDHASFAVPGGTTPGPIFDELSSVHLDWSRVHILLTDERWVPETSDRSNTALLKKRLLVDAAADAVYVPLHADTETPEESLETLSAGIDPELPISVLLLGMGADMHTASIFPGADNLKAALAADAPNLVAMRAPGAPEPRVTLSGRVLRNAMTTHVVITGAEKRAALEKARDLSPEDAPIRLVLDEATVHWAE